MKRLKRLLQQERERKASFSKQQQQSSTKIDGGDKVGEDINIPEHQSTTTTAGSYSHKRQHHHHPTRSISVLPLHRSSASLLQRCESVTATATATVTVPSISSLEESPSDLGHNQEMTQMPSPPNFLEMNKKKKDSKK